MMLELLFGSTTRVRLLRLFLQDHKTAFFVRELTRKIGAQINSVRNELDNLVDLGIVTAVKETAAETRSVGDRSSGQRKYYRVNAESFLFNELRALFFKARLLMEKDFVQKLVKAGQVQYLALTGYFAGLEGAPTDIFIVGRINRDKTASVIRAFEREIGREVNYTVMTPQEFKFRKDVTDKFLYSILESQKIVVVDTVTEKDKTAA